MVKIILWTSVENEYVLSRLYKLVHYIDQEDAIKIVVSGNKVGWYNTWLLYAHLFTTFPNLIDKFQK